MAELLYYPELDHIVSIREISLSLYLSIVVIFIFILLYVYLFILYLLFYYFIYIAFIISLLYLYLFYFHYFNVLHTFSKQLFFGHTVVHIVKQLIYVLKPVMYLKI